MGDCATESAFFASVKLYPSGNDRTNDEDDYLSIATSLDASTAFLPFFDIFGALLKLCKNDLEGNITKIKTKSAKVPDVTTFRQLLEYEINNKEAKAKDSACIAALWYKRALEFLATFLQELLKITEESIRPAFDTAYEATLKKYHGWIVQKTIMMVAKMLPSRSDVVSKLYSKDDEAKRQQFKHEAEQYLANLQPFVKDLHQLIVDLGLDSDTKV